MAVIQYETTDQTAKRLGLSKKSGPRQITKWCNEGKLPCVKEHGIWWVEEGAEPTVHRRPGGRREKG